MVRTPRVHAGPAISAWFDFVGDERLQSVCRHWDQLVSGRKLPDRRELDPRAFKSALPFVWLCEHVAPANTYLVRLAGEEINRLFDRSIRLRVLEDFLDQPQRDELADKFDQVLAGPAVLWSRGLLFATFENGPLGECVALPLRDGGQVRLVLGATVYEWHHPAFRQQSMLHAGGLLPTETQDTRILGLDDI